MVVVIVLMIVFGGIKYREGGDLSDDRIVVGSILLELRFIMFRLLPLFLRMIEDGAPVLGANIITLAVQGGGVMRLEEDVQQLIEAYGSRVIDQLKTFRMAGFPRANLFVGGIGNGTARIAGSHLQHAFHLLEDGFRAPKASGSKGGGLG